MRVLGRNMAYMLRCQEAARATGISLPEREEPVFTNLKYRFLIRCTQQTVLYSRIFVVIKHPVTTLL